MMVSFSEVMEDWSRINARDCPFVMEEREPPLSAAEIDIILADTPFSVCVEGAIGTLTRQLAQFPDALVADVEILAARFAELTGKESLRVRVAGIMTNACKKVHADFTDLRLITTYAGPGTDYAPHGDADCCLVRMPTGAIGLFKGKLFGVGHTPCLHRSPPIEGSGEKRLVVVIDTPRQSSD